MDSDSASAEEVIEYVLRATYTKGAIMATQQARDHFKHKTPFAEMRPEFEAVKLIFMAQMKDILLELVEEEYGKKKGFWKKLKFWQ